MPDLMTTLEKLKAAGVEPYTDAEVDDLAELLAETGDDRAIVPEHFVPGRLLATLLEKHSADALAVEALSYALTTRLTNQPEWMVGLVNRVNAYLEATGDKSRARVDGDGITLE